MTHEDDRTLTDALIAARDGGRRCVLATVLATKGSTPRKAGARMLVDPTTGLVGTVGGGCGEAEVIEAARQVMETGVAQRVQVDLTDDFLSWSPAVCGGIMDVFVEAIAAEPRVRIHYLRPPDREQIFDQRVLLEQEDVIVTLAKAIEFSSPMLIDGTVALEAGSDVVWSTFPGAWHDIGSFHREDGTFTGYYANVLTPVEIDGTVWRTTDLFLDVWLGADGRAQILDEDEFEAAVAAGWINAATASRAREEAGQLLELARSDDWPPPVTRAWTRTRALGLERAVGTDG